MLTYRYVDLLLCGPQPQGCYAVPTVVSMWGYESHESCRLRLEPEVQAFCPKGRRGRGGGEGDVRACLLWNLVFLVHSSVSSQKAFFVSPAVALGPHS